MSSHALLKHRNSPSRALKWILGLCTTAFIILFPILLCMAFVCSMLAVEDPTETPTSLVIFVLSWLPLSIPASIYFMWSRYKRGERRKALIFAGLPFYTFAAVLLIAGISDILFRG